MWKEREVGEVGRKVGRKKVRKQTPERSGEKILTSGNLGLTKVFAVIAK